MLRKTRIILASIACALMALLFLDFTGTLHPYLGWMAKFQLVPALLAHSIVIIFILALFTLLLGRVYCSVCCPLGVTQDCISNISGRLGKQKNRFSFSKAKTWLRYGTLALFIAALVANISIIVSLLDPYASFGRVAFNLLAPIYRTGNNILAWFAEATNTYAFYATDVWIKSGITFGIAVITIIVVGLLAWRSGRTYCNTICPVGTLLGFVSRFSIYKPAFDTEKCTKCGLCEKVCKASCIDSKNMTIDHSRCVTCFNCMEKCNSGAMEYALAFSKKKTPQPEKEPAENNNSAMTRRSVMAIAWTMAVASTAKAQQQLQLYADGGLADIEDKKAPERKNSIVPPGALGPENVRRHCSACQLCVSSCPNNVLRPSSKLATLMQPEMSFERGYCRPECTECSQVCPTNAIKKITTAEKTAISIGHPVWIKDNCIVNRDEVQCKSCERHCPTDAITLVDRDPGAPKSLKIPTIDNERCIGCGACEYYCPARPFSAIYIEGHHRHHTV